MVDDKKLIKVSEKVKTFLDDNKLVGEESYNNVLIRLLKINQR